MYIYIFSIETLSLLVDKFKNMLRKPLPFEGIKNMHLDLLSSKILDSTKCQSSVFGVKTERQKSQRLHPLCLSILVKHLLIWLSRLLPHGPHSIFMTRQKIVILTAALPPFNLCSAKYLTSVYNT